MPDENVAELTRVNWWIAQQLLADPAISLATSSRVFVDQAPQNSLLPCVIFSFLGGADKVVTTTARLSNAIYLIRGLAHGSTYSVLEDVADRIEQVLTVPDTGTIIRQVRITSCNREQPFQRSDAENGIPVVHLGGFYRIRFQSAFQ